MQGEGGPTHTRKASYTNPVFDVFDGCDDTDPDAVAAPELRGHERNISVQSYLAEHDSLAHSPKTSPTLEQLKSLGQYIPSEAPLHAFDDPVKDLDDSYTNQTNLDPALQGYRSSPWYLNLSTPFATVVATSKPGSRAEKAQQILSCRFLMSIFLLDAMGWGISKMAALEIVLLSERLGYSTIMAAVIIGAVEVTVEFMASAAAPSITLVVMQGRPLTSKTLTCMAMYAYTFSSAFGAVAYTTMILANAFFELDSFWFLVLWYVTEAVQYPFLNQIGDACQEMAKPHWIETFKGSTLMFPGYFVNRGYVDCCVGKKGERSLNELKKWNVCAETDTSSLPLFLVLSKFLVMALVAAGFSVSHATPTLRYTFVIGCAWFDAIVSCMLTRNLDTLVAGVVEQDLEEEVKGSDSKPKSITWLEGAEIPLVLFNVFVFGIPQQAYAGLSVVLIKNIPSYVMVVAGILVIFYFTRRIQHVAGRHDIDHGMGGQSCLETPEGTPRKGVQDLSRDSSVSSTIYAAPLGGGDSTQVLIRHGDLGVSPAHNRVQQLLPENTEPSASLEVIPTPARAKFSRSASPIKTWVLKTVAMLILLSGAAFTIYFVPKSLLMLAALTITPYMCVVNDLRSDFDSLLMIYKEERRSVVMFWVNVLQVIITGPLLALNVFLITTVNFDNPDSDKGDSDEEARQTAQVLIACGAFFVVVAAYFALVDPYLPAKYNLHRTAWEALMRQRKVLM